MNKALIFALVFASTAAIAQTYQWKDASGKTVISDTPPPGSAKSTRTIGGHAPAVVTEKPAETGEKTAPATTADKNMEFKKRQQEAKERADKEAKEQMAAKDRKDNCERARQNLTSLEANRPMASYNEKGERQIMDTAQREQEMERARRVMSESCGQ
jgi:hypothetical protein